MSVELTPKRQPADGLDLLLGHVGAHLAAIVESSDDAIVSKDLTGKILSWNTAAQRIFGYQASEIVGRSILTLIPPELQHEEAEILRKLRLGERIDHYETVRLRKNGERFPISVTISPVRDATGRVIGASKIARDISERRRMAGERNWLAGIVESADDAIISKDLNGVIQTWNEGARRLFGYTAEEIIGRPILLLIPEELHPEESAILSRLRAGERIQHYETVRQKKSGERVEISVTISPIRDETGRVIGASKIARDISERRRLERLLMQSEKLAATGRMAATIAHEINNPLESLINLVYLARQATPEQSPAREFLVTAEQEIERVSHLARQTLGYYKDPGIQVDVQLDELLDRVLKVYHTKIRSVGIRVETSYMARESIRVSKGEMTQVFSNVVANAIDAMGDGGVLQIATRRETRAESDGIEVLIKDTGLGIGPELMPRIFEPFFTTKGSVGTGIGLWVTRRLVEDRGGSISVSSSTGEGSAGTTVTVFLPFEAKLEPRRRL